MTDADGKVVADTVYKPFGEVYQEASAGRDIYRSKFNGNEWDRDGEMYYFNARYYDPVLGRFLQADNLLFGTNGEHAATLNSYAFAGNNPVTYSDPGGNFVLLSFLIASLVYMASVAYAVATSALMYSIVFNAVYYAVSYAVFAAAWYGVVDVLIMGKEFNAREFGLTVGLAAAGGVGGIFFAGFEAASVYAATRYAASLSRYGVAASRIATVGGVSWKTASKIAYYTAWIGGGVVGSVTGSVLKQWKLEGHVEAGKTLLAALSGGLFGAAGGKFTASYFKSAPWQKINLNFGYAAKHLPTRAILHFN